MEGNETSMSSNVAVTIGSGNLDAEMRERTALEAVEVKDVVAAADSSDLNQTAADQILNSAKEEGFEKTLVFLANGAFQEGDEADLEGEVKILENSEAANSGISDTEEIKDVEDQKDGSLQQIERIKDLEEKVRTTEEKNRDLVEKLERVEGNNTKALQTMYEMTLIMQEMLKDEKDEKEKVSKLQLLLQIMLTLMNAMFMPEDSRGVQKSIESYENQNITQTEKKKRSVEDIVKDLRGQGKIRTERQIKEDVAESAALAA